MVRPNSSLLVATLCLAPMGSLWAYIEGMDVTCLLFAGANGSDLAAWARFGTLAHFKRCLLLQYVLVLPNSSTHVATLYLGSMRSLWAYIEGMDDLYLLFMGENSFNLAAWAPGLALWTSSRDVYTSCMFWCSPILLRMLQHCIWEPWGAFGHILKEWMAFISFSRGQMCRICLPGPGLALLTSPKDVCSSSMFWCFPILLRICCNIAFGTHGEPLGIY